MDVSVEVTEAAIAAVWRGANEAWKQEAMQVVRDIAANQETLIASDVSAVLESKDVDTHDLRAMGPVMRRAAKAGLISPTMEFVPDPLPRRHRCPVRVWKSNVYEITL